jgi:hypothetical protein
MSGVAATRRSCARRSFGMLIFMEGLCSAVWEARDRLRGAVGVPRGPTQCRANPDL